MYDDYVEILKMFEKLNIKMDCYKIMPRTFLDVVGFPHWENVWSNIIAFFLDANAEHKLGDLWAKSLLECLGETDVIIEAMDVITREYHTEKNGRIDIVLKSNEYIIGIENKVYSGITNDLDSYKETIDACVTDNCKSRCILLTLYDNFDCAEKYGWKNVTYEDLFLQVEKNIGAYYSEMDMEWSIFMKQFMTTVKGRINKIRGVSVLDTDIRNFIEDNNESISKFLEEMYKTKKFLNSKADNITREIKADEQIISILDQKKPFYIWPWHEPHWEIGSAAVISFPRDGFELKIDVYFYSGCEIYLFYKDESLIDRLKDEISKLEVTNYVVKNNRILLEKLDLDANVDDIIASVKRAVVIASKVL